MKILEQNCEPIKAESDIRIAKAEAEKRRTMAVAMEQENLAKVRDMEAKLVEAQAAVPLAMAEALDQVN